MTTISAPAASAFLSLLLIATALPAQSSDPAPSTTGVSKVRIVRLSEVKGVVQVSINTGRGFEDATVNLPIVEETRLQTGTGAAEVEFEDNSTLRLAPDTLVEFPRLELLPSGAKLSSVHVLKGMVYVSLVNTRGNEFTLLFGQQKLQLPPSSHVRLQLEPSEAKLAVLSGAVSIDGPSGAVEVPKKRTVSFPLADQGQPEVAKNVAPQPYDSWDHDAADYHQRFASSNAFGSVPYSYGVSDMMYYGSFINSAGCGSMWHPYFASSSWEPFSNGAWAWYPGAGYSWVSPYPWGWTAYHSGSWAYCSGSGWGWLPGSNWTGLNNTSAAVTTGSSPHPPVRSPLRGEPSLVAVNLKPLTASALGPEDSFVFRKDSAGLGVPRGTLGNLDKLSQHAVEHGMASTHVYVEAPSSAMNREPAAASPALAGTSLHRGYAPPAASGVAPTSQGSSAAMQNSVMSAPSSTSHMGSSSGGGRPH
jgi:FecR protein